MIRCLFFLLTIAGPFKYAEAQTENVSGISNGQIMGWVVLVLVAMVIFVSVLIKKKETRVQVELKNSFEGEDNPVPQVPAPGIPQERGSLDDEVDPVAEADVYMAYGRDAQAEEILKETLAKHPDNNRAKLKLLEIHVGRKDENSFRKALDDLRTTASGDSEVWEKAVLLGRSVGFDLDCSLGERVPQILALEAVAHDASPGKTRQRESKEALSRVLSDIKELVDRGEFGDSATVGVKKTENGESSSKYVITIELK